MRPEGWESLLAAHITTARAQPFAWGERDCVLWCADWVLQIRGVDYAEHCRGAYATEDQAAQLLDELGFASVSDLVDGHLDVTPVKYARRGDVMLHPSGMLGICDGAHAYFLTASSVTRIGFLHCTRAWTV